jgi:hypothetical protein
MYSGLPGLLADFAIHCTWDGDNTVMALQTSRSLVADQRKVFNGQSEQLKGFQSYLVGPSPTVLTQLRTLTDFLRSDLQYDVCSFSFIQLYSLSLIHPIPSDPI